MAKERDREKERKRDRKGETLNHLSIHQWVRSAILAPQQRTSPIGFSFLKLPPPPCAVLLVIPYEIHEVQSLVRHLPIFALREDQVAFPLTGMHFARENGGQDRPGLTFITAWITEGIRQIPMARCHWLVNRSHRDGNSWNKDPNILGVVCSSYWLLHRHGFFHDLTCYSQPKDWINKSSSCISIQRIN